jgi:hypothetical protein
LGDGEVKWLTFSEGYKMGMYTGLRVKCTVKEDFTSLIDDLHQHHDWANAFLEIAHLCDHGINTEGDIASYVLLFIPFGMVWGDQYSRFDGRVWEFCCSLKNYEGEIKDFFEKVLSQIAEDVSYCEVLYKEDSRGCLYSLVDGAMTCCGYKSYDDEVA